jgi:hypothetical protein
MADLQGHPKLGFSWEGFCLEQLIGGQGTRDVYFWQHMQALNWIFLSQ